MTELAICFFSILLIGSVMSLFQGVPTHRIEKSDGTSHTVHVYDARISLFWGAVSLVALVILLAQY